jgi:hypothetical protein
MAARPRGPNIELVFTDASSRAAATRRIAEEPTERHDVLVGRRVQGQKPAAQPGPPRERDEAVRILRSEETISASELGDGGKVGGRAEV